VYGSSCWHTSSAPTLPGHAGGPPLVEAVSADLMPDAVERAMDEAGFRTAHIVGNSLGGFVALQLAARGRARSVVAFAPAGGWGDGDDSLAETLALQARLHEQLLAAAPHGAALCSTPEGRRRATALITTSFEHIPAELLEHQMLGIARCEAGPMIEYAAAHGYSLDAERVSCPVRVVWGRQDRLLPWPSAAARFRADWLPQADWIVLDGVGHCPQLDVPLEAAQLILGFTAS
jgi:pimeloyl-ACP methyl ester carboxylesterase